MFSLFNNLRMVFKIGLIALLMGGVTLGLVSYTGSRMSGSWPGRFWIVCTCRPLLS